MAFLWKEGGGVGSGGGVMGWKRGEVGWAARGGWWYGGRLRGECRDVEGDKVRGNDLLFYEAVRTIASDFLIEVLYHSSTDLAILNTYLMVSQE